MEYGFVGVVMGAPDIVSVALTTFPSVGVIELGANWKVRPLGSPVTLKLTGELNPPVGVMLIWTVPGAP